jgi:hypothetical protein
MGEIILAGETEVIKKNCPLAAFSTTNPTWTDIGPNPGILDKGWRLAA